MHEVAVFGNRRAGELHLSLSENCEARICLMGTGVMVQCSRCGVLASHPGVPGLQVWVHFLFQLPASMKPSRQQVMAQVLGPNATNVGDTEIVLSSWLKSEQPASHLAWGHLENKPADGRQVREGTATYQTLRLSSVHLPS